MLLPKQLQRMLEQIEAGEGNLSMTMKGLDEPTRRITRCSQPVGAGHPGRGLCCWGRLCSSRDCTKSGPSGRQGPFSLSWRVLSMSVLITAGSGPVHLALGAVGHGNASLAWLEMAYSGDRPAHRWASDLVLRTALAFDQDNGAVMSRSIAYYALFSLFPLMLVLMSFSSSLLSVGGGPTSSSWSLWSSICRRPVILL